MTKDPLQIEQLEPRCQPSATTISGHVFYDANNNGLMDPGEIPLANTRIELRNSQNVVVGTATSDANGFYQFDHDQTVPTTAQTLTKTLTFPTTQTNFAMGGQVDQFDPSLGDLISVQITNAGSITSDIAAENTSTASPSTISATVGGRLTLTGPNGLSLVTDMDQNAGTFQASTFDGKLDFAGASGLDFGSKTANGQKSVTLTGADMAPFIGTGSVSLLEMATANSSATGGGNVLVNITSSGQSQVTVVYSYVASNRLKPGSYTLVKPGDPPGFIDGKESRNGLVLNNPPNASVIPLMLTGTDLPNNDFGELKGSSLSGYVWLDISKTGYNDGIKQPDEGGIPNIMVTLTGTDDTGSVHKIAITDGTGYYKIDQLRPGIYTLTEGGVPGYADGKDTIGTPGGFQGNDQFSNINLPASYDGVNNDFGEIVPTATAPPVVAAAVGQAPPPAADAFTFGPLNLTTPPLPVLSKGQLLGLPDSRQQSMTSDARFINAVSDAVLGHDADATSLANWLSFLNSGHTRAQVVDGIWNSQEHRQRQVIALYQGIVGVSPPPTSLAIYVAMFQAGATELDVTAAIASSPAATARFASDNAYVNMLYLLVLGRPASAAEQTAWITSGLDRRTMALRLMTTPDGEAALVGRVYTQLLRRPVSPVEANYWVSRFQGGLSFGDFVKVILGSSDFQALVG
jgi:hypothetical protein